MPINHIICPISTRKIDSNVSRLTVFINVIFMSLYLVTSNPAFIVAASLDYFIRAIPKTEYSPVRAVSIWFISMTGIHKKAIDFAPKIFASRLGTICAAAAAVLYFTGFLKTSIAVTGTLLVLSIMDSVFNFCVGCLIYNYIVYPFYKDK